MREYEFHILPQLNLSRLSDDYDYYDGNLRRMAHDRG